MTTPDKQTFRDAMACGRGGQYHHHRRPCWQSGLHRQRRMQRHRLAPDAIGMS